MPSWNIHIAHTEGLLSSGGPVARMVRDRNAFLFGNLIPDIYVGYMVPAIAEPIPYRVTHLAVPEHIPKPREREFWDAYVEPLARALSIGGSMGIRGLGGDDASDRQAVPDGQVLADGASGEAAVGTEACPAGWIIDAGSLAAEVEHVSPAHRAGYELRADPRDTARLQREAFERAAVLDAWSGHAGCASVVGAEEIAGASDVQGVPDGAAPAAVFRGRGHLLDMQSVSDGAAPDTSGFDGHAHDEGALNTSISDELPLNGATFSTFRTFLGQNDPKNVRNLLKECAAADCRADAAADCPADAAADCRADAPADGPTNGPADGQTNNPAGAPTSGPADGQVGTPAGGALLASVDRSLFDMVLGTWVHLLADAIWNQHVNDFLDERGEKPSSDFRIKKQSDFDQFGKSLHIDAMPLATPHLVELAARFPQYEIDERSVYATVAVAHEVVRTNTLFSDPVYRLLTREFFDQTFNEVQREADRRFVERMRHMGRGERRI